MKFSIPQNRYPAVVSVAIALVCGASCVQLLPFLPGAWAFALVGVVLSVAAYFRLHIPAAFLCGILWALAVAGTRLDPSLPNSSERQTATIEGVILTIPQAFDHGFRFDFDIQRTIEPAELILPSRVRLSWYDHRTSLKAGERWQLRVKLKPPHGMLNPGGLDYERWLFAQGIRAVGYVTESPDNRRLNVPDLPYSFEVWRQALYDRLSATLDGEPLAGIVKALIMGAADDISPAQWDVLRRTGTTHLVVISGSHIGLVAGFVFFLIRRAWSSLATMRWSPPTVAAVAAFTAALLYSALADFAIPTQRAVIMIGIVMGAVIAQRHLSGFRVLATALLAVVLYDPLAVLAPGFWLSFAAVALILFVVSYRRGKLRGWRAMLRVNWATSLGLAPLLMLFFQQVSLISPIANLFAVPLIGLLLIPLCLTGALLLPILPLAGEALLILASRLLEWTWPILLWLAELPAAQWIHAEPPLWTIPLALAGFVLLLAPRGIPARWLGLVLAVPALTAQPASPPQAGFRLTVLDVGQGLGVAVETREHLMIFDTGARYGSRFDIGSAVIEPYLRHRGIERIDALIVSHGDNDHIGGAPSLLKRFTVGRTYTSVPEKLAEFPTETCKAEQFWEWDGVKFEMLGPIEKSPHENDNSCVLKISGAGGSALLTGDIEKTGERLLVERYGRGLTSDILVVPHHGSKTSSSLDFLTLVKPRFALIPAGYLNRYGFPHRPVLKRYRDLAIPVLNTAEAGALSILIGDGRKDLKVESYRKESGRYWNAHPKTTTE
ncbi:DNA internalization-related competence protein ComEC/Rec2 [Methylocaldum marinum]|uniref:DNA internalization-related competence protein ComEC/Rec2 n=1 Tax=Methylocaldum marinum TaxID=1432792 RepID=A0A250KPW9_9GAMM|nr:DNA internalization-related competence protein ComEC/Rec2 [Methylocaldum marinum]BBA33648.1 DNA internalization-related competence protein ComEC/Rec2 [Methylocaldum marinum]